MKKSMLLAIIFMVVCTMAFGALTVTEQVGTSQQDPTGTVATIGLSNYEGVMFSLSGGSYSAAQPGAQAQAVGSGGGNKFGAGARLQYTVYGQGSTYKITASVPIDDAEVLYCGIANKPSSAKVANSRTSGSIGTITSSGGTDRKANYSAASDYASITETNLYMFLLTETDKELIGSIDGTDMWTGTESTDGPLLYYELLSPTDVVVTYTLGAES